VQALGGRADTQAAVADEGYSTFARAIHHFIESGKAPTKL
jgi:hypothetical protein